MSIIRPWKILRSETLMDCRIFKVRKDVVVSPRTNKEHDMFVVESADYVNIVPLTPQNEVVLVEQYRHGTRELSLEIPGGLADGVEESFQDCARRELLEETGYSAEEFVKIGEAYPNAAMQSTKIFYVLARNCRKVAEPCLDGAEDIAVRLVPLADIPRLIESCHLNHALMVAAFYYLNQFLKGADSVDR